MDDREILLDDVPLSAFHLKVTAFTTGGMFCDGYILGMIGIALVTWDVQQPHSALVQGLVGASALVGIFLGALLLGPLTDRLGRQKLYLADLLLFVLGSVLQFFVAQPWQLIVLRLIMGVAIGADYAIGAALLSEFLPRAQRGPLLASLNAVWTVGYVAAFVVGYAVRDTSPESWRWMLASSAIPAALVLGLRLGTPESPRWLAAQGRTAEADRVLAEFFGPNVVLGPPPPDVGHAGLTTLFQPRWRRHTVFAATFWFCQVLPFFALTTFEPTVLASLGLADKFTGGLVLNLFQLVGGVVGLVVMNMLSRRGFVIWSFVAMAVSLLPLVLAVGPNGALVVGCFGLFVFIVSGAGNLETVYPAEMFPTQLRATGVGFAAGMSRIGAAIGTFLLPIGLQTLGTRVTVGIGVAVLVIGAVTSWWWAPETRHLILSEASSGRPLPAPDPRPATT